MNWFSLTQRQLLPRAGTLALLKVSAIKKKRGFISPLAEWKWKRQSDIWSALRQNWDEEKNGKKVDIQGVHVLKDTLVANTCREQVII